MCIMFKDKLQNWSFIKSNKYLHHDACEKEVTININVNKGSENSIEKTLPTSCKLIIAGYASAVYHISCTR